MNLVEKVDRLVKEKEKLRREKYYLDQEIIELEESRMGNRVKRWFGR